MIGDLLKFVGICSEMASWVMKKDIKQVKLRDIFSPESGGSGNAIIATNDINAIGKIIVNT